MKTLSVFALFASLLCVQAQKDITFINPEDNSVSRSKNFALNPTYVIGSSLNIQWTKSNNNISLVMYQERPGDQFEYIFQNSFDVSSFRWTVGTQKDLKDGSVFFFQIFKTGETGPTTGTRYFNLTRGRNEDDEVKTTKSSTITSSTITSTSSTQSQTSTTTTSTGSTNPTTGNAINDGIDNKNNTTAIKNEEGGLSTGAKVGMGVGIPVAVIIGVLAGWFFFGRKRKDTSQDYTSNVPPYHETKYTPPGDETYAADASHEQAGGYYKPQQQQQQSQPSELYTPSNAPVEMPSQRY